MSDLSKQKSMHRVALKERYPLSRPGSGKRIYHVVLDVAHLPLHYRAGDCIAIQPENDPGQVAAILSALNASGSEVITDTRSGEVVPFSEMLGRRLNLSRVPKKLIEALVAIHGDKGKQQWLGELLLPGHERALSQYTEMREVWDVLGEHREAKIAPSELCRLLGPLLPRFYSIASSPQVAKGEVHLTVGLVAYEGSGLPRRGVCSHYLCHIAPIEEPAVSVYIHPTEHFLLPDDSATPVIMVGPGTGVAPFRAFMQERTASGATGGHWLFFGDRHRAYDFAYESYWEELVTAGKLRLDVAFSRDQEQKVYVQDKMLENGKELWQWLQEGAFFYVCGDARHMAKDVDAALSRIAQVHGGLDAEGAKAYLKALRHDKRYLRDVY